MKANDPLLEARQNELFERIKKMNELMLVVFKNHIGLEQFMTEFLEASGIEYENMLFVY